MLVVKAKRKLIPRSAYAKGSPKPHAFEIVRNPTTEYGVKYLTKMRDNIVQGWFRKSSASKIVGYKTKKI